MSTGSTQGSKNLADDCNAKGVIFLEANVSGSVKKPARKKVHWYNGGRANEDYQKALPYLSPGKTRLYR